MSTMESSHRVSSVLYSLSASCRAMFGRLGRLSSRVLERMARAAARNRSTSDPIEWRWGSTPYNRIALINRLVARFPDCRYLEIGCDLNQLFHSVPAPIKTGVDPLRGGTERMTSDAFFAGNEATFDIAFLDGLHTYDQIRKDVVNALSCVRTGGYVALHDMLPSSWVECHVPRVSNGWSGDVWKVAFELARTEGVELKIVKIDQGVGVARILTPKPELFDLQAELVDRTFDYFKSNLDRLPVIEWAEAVEWIDAGCGQAAVAGSPIA